MLSKTDRSNEKDDSPRAGDDLVQVGNRDNKERQSVIMISAYQSFDPEIKAPYWAQYEGVNEYKLSPYRMTFFSHGKSAVYGDMMIKAGDGYVSQAGINTQTDKRFAALEIDADKIRTEVANTEKTLVSKIDQTADSISLTVQNGTRPNLLCGSDLNLDGVDTTDKAAIAKHLGVGLGITKVDNTEWFEYLKGGGISGADAIKFKAMKGTSEFAGLFWESANGAARNLQLKPNTVYTLSAWVRTEFDTEAQGYCVFAFEAFKKENIDSGPRVGRLAFGAASNFFEPIGEWTRVSATFTTEELQYGSVAMWVNGTKPATLYICRPKLEEGDMATPWCEYDGTEEGLRRAGVDVKTGEITLDAAKTTVKGDLTAKSLQTEGDPAKGGATIVAKNGVITFFGINKSAPDLEIGLNNAGEVVIKVYKDGKFLYDLGPSTIFPQVSERDSSFTRCSLHKICSRDGRDMDSLFSGDFPNNYNDVVAYLFREGYKKVGNETRYKVSGTAEPSKYNAVHFIAKWDANSVTEGQLERTTRIDDGWYLEDGALALNNPTLPTQHGSGTPNYTTQVTYRVRFYSEGKATSMTGSFTVEGNKQRGWTVIRRDMLFI